jgi:hypothetical protein
MVRLEAEMSARVGGLSVTFGHRYRLFPDDQNIQKRNQTLRFLLSLRQILASGIHIAVIMLKNIHRSCISRRLKTGITLLANASSNLTDPPKHIHKRQTYPRDREDVM